MKIKKYSFGKLIRDIMILLVVLVSISLFVYILVSSFKPLSEVMAKAKFLPQEPTVKNYVALFTSTSSNKNFPKYMGNSLVVSICAAVLSCVISSFAAYGFSRHNYFGKNAMLNSMLFLYVFPTIILLVPLYKMYSAIGLVDNYL